jgi:hypothetical protein
MCIGATATVVENTLALRAALYQLRKTGGREWTVMDTAVGRVLEPIRSNLDQSKFTDDIHVLVQAYDSRRCLTEDEFEVYDDPDVARLIQCVLPSMQLPDKPLAKVIAVLGRGEVKAEPELYQEFEQQTGTDSRMIYVNCHSRPVARIARWAIKEAVSYTSVDCEVWHTRGVVRVKTNSNADHIIALDVIRPQLAAMMARLGAIRYRLTSFLVKDSYVAKGEIYATVPASEGRRQLVEQHPDLFTIDDADVNRVYLASTMESVTRRDLGLFLTSEGEMTKLRVNERNRLIARSAIIVESKSTVMRDFRIFYSMRASLTATERAVVSAQFSDPVVRIVLKNL